MNHEQIEQQTLDWDTKAQGAEAAATAAFARLLEIAEQGYSGQARTVANFIAATFDGQTFTFDFFDLRTVDVNIGDDMLVCLDALRWGKADLYKLVPHGYRRIIAMCEKRGLA